MPPADQVRDALERVLASGTFARSERARDLLRYLVEQELGGNAERLKGFSIAVDVFGKDDSFDPATDPVVRVQAGRLRDLLDQYYREEGRDDPLQIGVPRGSYVPLYETMTIEKPPRPDEAAIAPGPTSEPREARADTMAYPDRGLQRLVHRPGLLVAGICLAIFLAAAALWRASAPFGHDEGDAVAARLSDSVSGVNLSDLTGSVPQEMLPSVFIDVTAGSYGGEPVAGALRRGLAAFDTVYFIGRQATSDSGAQRRTDFVFAVSPAGGEGDVHVELQNLSSGKVLLSRNLATANRSQAALDDDIADILTTVAPVSGVVYAYMAESGVQTMLTRCLSLNERFYRDQTSAMHRQAYECLEKLSAMQLGSSLVYSELASLHVQAIVSRYRYPVAPSFQQALDLARKAVQLAPNSPYAHRSMGYVLSRSASAEEGLRWTRKAYELNTFDLGIAASYGYALIFNGAYENGASILGRAVSVASAHPTWWDYGLFLGHFMLGEKQAAANAVSALGSSRRAHYVAARLIAADGLGAREEANALLAELHADYPNFATNPQAFFDRGNYPQALAARLVEALRAAGLKSAS